MLLILIYISILFAFTYDPVHLFTFLCCAGENDITLDMKRSDRQNKMAEDVKAMLRDKLDVNLPLDDEGTRLVWGHFIIYLLHHFPI